MSVRPARYFFDENDQDFYVGSPDKGNQTAAKDLQVATLNDKLQFLQSTASSSATTRRKTSPTSFARTRPQLRKTSGTRRRRRTQLELQMEQAIRFGYLDVPNVSIVTGKPLICEPMEKFTKQHCGGPDEVQRIVRRLCREIWRRRLER